MLVRILLFFFCALISEASFSAGSIRFEIFDAAKWAEKVYSAGEEYIAPDVFSSQGEAQNEAAYLRLLQNMLGGAALVFPLSSKNELLLGTGKTFSSEKEWYGFQYKVYTYFQRLWSSSEATSSREYPNPPVVWLDQYKKIKNREITKENGGFKRLFQKLKIATEEAAGAEPATASSATASSATTPGRVRFAPIPNIRDINWWQHGEQAAWTDWDPHTYYVWGANKENMKMRNPADILGGSGMASPKIMARGHGHSHYIGMNTVTAGGEGNEAVYQELKDFLLAGNNIIFPTLNGAFSLGSGSAAKNHLKKPKGWYQSQAKILLNIQRLFRHANGVDYPEKGMNWVDKKGVIGNRIINTNAQFTALQKAVQAEADKP